MPHAIKELLIILILSGAVFPAQAQQPFEEGLPFVTNYSPEVYNAFDQNWDATQDASGRMYFANGDGVLVYDGVRWSLIPLPNKATVFAVSADQNGKIYVGALGEFGFLESNDIGQLVYSSLVPELSEEFLDFSEIRTICITGQGIYFSSKKYLFRWDGEQFKTWENSGDSNIFSVYNTILTRSRGVGLMVLENDSLQLFTHGEFFAEHKIYAIIPYRDNNLLIATGNKLFTFDGTEYKEFKTNAEDFLSDNILYKGIALSDQSFAFGSLNKGIIILDDLGQKIAILDESNALRNNGVLDLYQDEAGLLWASLYSGIVKIEYPSPFTYFNEFNNTPEMVFTFHRHNGKFLIGGPDGLFYLHTSTNAGKAQFERVTGNYGAIWDIVSFKDELLIGGTNGVFKVDKDLTAEKIADFTLSTFYQSEIDLNRLYMGGESGLTSMYYKNGALTLEHKFNDVHSFVDKVLEMKNGDLWLGLDRNELIHISFNSLDNAKTLIDPLTKVYSPTNGLPDDRGIPYIIEDQLYFVADFGIYKYESVLDSFIANDKLHNQLGLNNKTSKINFIDNQEQIWLIETTAENPKDQIVATKQSDGTYSIRYLEEERIMGFRNSIRLYQELVDSVVWYKTNQGIVRHNLRTKELLRQPTPNTVIANITWNADSILYGGHKSLLSRKLPFSNSPLRFYYASPFFYEEAQNQYQVKLDGFDKKWSSWSLETQKDYTNIPEGKYTFKVRSKNIYGQIGLEAGYSFTVLPPWYRCWYMYLLYAIGTIGFVTVASRWRSQSLKKRNLLLEEIITARTAEIHHKNELLMHQTEKLVETNDAKTELYSNITHEFRTPLTVILGMSDILKENIIEKKFDNADESLELIRRNGKNLLHLVNEMLDLAKSESGNMELRKLQGDVIPFVKYLSESFSSLAEEHNIQLTIYSEIDSLMMDFDASKMTSIITNLLSNAIKFTPEFGKIIVHIKQVIEENDEHLFIKVKDDGRGIPAEDIPNIFNRFYQSNETFSRKNEGSGIGLALTKELVDLMNGRIEVKSALNKGSEFNLLIPVTRQAPVSNSLPMESESRPTPLTKKIATTEHDDESSSGLPLVLIIEDNMDVAHYLKTSLIHKYETLHAVNGLDGIEIALEKIPDIIICDVMMPGKNGFEVCATLKADERTDHIPIIILTAKVTIEDKITGLSQGADAYLAKPFNKEELFIRLDQLVLLRKKLIGKIQKDGYNAFLDKKEKDPKIQFLQKVVKLIHDEIGNADFGSTELSKKLLASDSQVYRKIKAITGKSTSVFIRSIRLQYAKDLLQNTHKTVAEVAYEVGFNDPSWFSRAFKDEFGVAPSSIAK